jgi:hypothetical protein
MGMGVIVLAKLRLAMSVMEGQLQHLIADLLHVEMELTITGIKITEMTAILIQAMGEATTEELKMDGNEATHLEESVFETSFP